MRKLTPRPSSPFFFSAGLKQACPQGVFVSLTPGDPSLWSGVIFVRKGPSPFSHSFLSPWQGQRRGRETKKTKKLKRRGKNKPGPYAPAILRFQVSFPDTYPSLPPLVTFSTDMFHPLVTPLTTYMYSTDVQAGGTASASDAERLPPGGFSLRHGFAAWFGRGSRAAREARGRDVSGGGSSVRSGGGGGGGREEVAVMMTPTRAVATATGTPRSAESAASSDASVPGYAQTGRREVSTYEVLRYLRSVFDDEDVLDSVPLEAAGNPGAWHAWRTHRKLAAGQGEGAGVGSEGEVSQAETGPAAAAAAAAVTTRRPGEWNWEGVWEERVKKGIAASLSDGVLFGSAGTADEVVCCSLRAVVLRAGC